MSSALACAVLSYQDEPYLVQAVRSVLQQDVEVEVVVINSGGGDPSARLSAAGLDVPVHSVSHGLRAGGVRNMAIDRTNARYLAFLAADCLAGPGWAAARLRAHDAGAAAVASAMTNAYPESTSAWASLMILHGRRMAVTRPSQRLMYSLSYDRALFERFGRFREDLPAGEDTEFNARFRGHATTAFAADVITAHRYPTEPLSMLHDAFRRGGLQARMQGALEGRGPRNIRVAVRGPLGVIRAVDLAARTQGPERARLVRALPLAVAASVSYTLGALTA